METIDQLKEAMVEGDSDACAALAYDLVARGADLKAVIDVLAAEMEEVGRRFECMEIFLPEVLFAADAMTSIMEVFGPELAKEQARGRKGTVIVGTARGDMHQIGKDLVALFLGIAGYEVIDMGTDVDPLDFIHRAEETKAEVIGISSLMTTTMPGATEVIAILRDKGIRDTVKVIVGGAPTSQEWADKIDADGWAEDSTGAVHIVKELMEGGI
ncbi:MAG: cobalamin-dependent protein [Thermoleophilia bacterium]|nr:cobalamin-dependent protein [Thermoleophilia bacterium]